MNEITLTLCYNKRQPSSKTTALKMKVFKVIYDETYKTIIFLTNVLLW